MDETLRARTPLSLVLLLFALASARVAPAAAEEPEPGIQDAAEIEKALTVVKTRGIRPTRPGEAQPGGGRIDLRLEFEFDSQRLTPTARAQLDQLAIAMRSDALLAASIQVVGHTDAKGSAEYNRSLSVRRANAVKDYLVEDLGLSAERLSAIGKGEERLLLPNDPDNGKNRRVEFINVQVAE